VTTALPATIDPFGTLDVAATFTPTTAGVQSETLTAIGASGETLCSIPVSASARAAVFTMATAVKTPFSGGLFTGDAGEAEFTITNTGDAALTLSTADPTDSHFTITARPAGVLAPSASQSLKVRFQSPTRRSPSGQ